MLPKTICPWIPDHNHFASAVSESRNYLTWTSYRMSSYLGRSWVHMTRLASWFWYGELDEIGNCRRVTVGINLNGEENQEKRFAGNSWRTDSRRSPCNILSTTQTWSIPWKQQNMQVTLRINMSSRTVSVIRFSNLLRAVKRTCQHSLTMPRTHNQDLVWANKAKKETLILYSR
jgi:hypothetical protein